MLFLDYEEYKTKYAETQRQYDEILSEKEELFASTQPNAVKYDADIVSGGKQENAFDVYLMQKERKRIDERLEEIKKLLIDRENLLAAKRVELYASHEQYDKIYLMRFIEKLNGYKIAKKIHYSPSQVYRILEQIGKMIEKMQ